MPNLMEILSGQPQVVESGQTRLPTGFEVQSLQQELANPSYQPKTGGGLAMALLGQAIRGRQLRDLEAQKELAINTADSRLLEALAGPQPIMEEQPGPTMSGSPLMAEVGQTAPPTMLEALIQHPEYKKTAIDSMLSKTTTGLASAKTEILADGTVVQAMPDGTVIVKDREGNEVTGQARLDALDAAEDAEIRQASGKAGAAESAKQQAQIDAAMEKELNKFLGSEGAKVYRGLQQAAQEASAFLPKLNDIKRMIEGADTGAYAPTALAVGKYLGFDVSDQETLNAALMGLAQDILNQQTGTKTDFDFKVAVEQAASIGKSPKANMALIQALIDRQERAVQFGDMAAEAMQKGGAQGVLNMRYEPPKEEPKEEPEDGVTKVGGYKIRVKD